MTVGRQLFPWLLGSLSLTPAFFLPAAWQWTSVPVMAELVGVGYWIVWPRW